MMFCNDPLLSYLKEYGYNIVRLPRADIKPLQLLARKGNNLERLGDLTTLMVAGSSISLPSINADIRSANVSGKQTGSFSLGLGLTFLGTIIGAMGGSKLGLDTKYQQAKSVAFEFQDVFQDSVEIAALDQYLGDADINPASRHVADLLEADEIYITTAVLKTNKLTVEATKSDNKSLELSIPEIQQLVGAEVKVSGDSSLSSKIAYSSDEQLVFGFQAVRIFYEQGSYTAFEPVDAGSAALREISINADDGTSRLSTASPFVRLTDL